MTETPRPTREQVDVDALMHRAEQALRALSKAVLVVAPTLKHPYPDAPDTSPWERFVHKPASEAYNLAAELRVALAARTPQPAAVGRCGHPLTMFGRTSLCALPADHRGWHRDGATEWSDGSQPAVPDGEPR